MVKGIHGASTLGILFSSIDVGSVSTACASASVGDGTAAACRSMQEYKWESCHFKQPGLDHRRAIKLACKLHAHSVGYANKLVTTASRCAIENNNTSHNHVLGPGASSIPPNPR
eukprot:1148979-Pelagomonas_calceolata.AAC.1